MATLATISTTSSIGSQSIGAMISFSNMTHQELKEAIKDAMRAKDAVRLSVLRGLSASATNELVAKSRKPDEMLGDDELLTVIIRAAKQRKDSIEQYTNGGRADLAEVEEAELTIIETFLPTLMSTGEVRPIVEAKKSELGITGKADAGKLMKAVMADLKGKADGNTVKAIVDSILS